MVELPLLILAQVALPVTILVMALLVGKIIEIRHLARIREREGLSGARPAITAGTWDNSREVASVMLATGAVVVSVDYFKRFLAGLYNLVGGRVRSYESILDRGRREALLRMKESCPQADIFVNLRIETSMLANTMPKGQYLAGIEVVAYGTAICYGKSVEHEVFAKKPG